MLLPVSGAFLALAAGTAWEGFRSALRSPYLLGISGYVLFLTVVATFIYFTRLQMIAALDEDKYKSKAFIDTFVYRTGDVVGAWTEGLLGRLGMGVAALATLVVPLAVVWAGLGVWLGRAPALPLDGRTVASFVD